jgi:hypothetical protein
MVTKKIVGSVSRSGMDCRNPGRHGRIRTHPAGLDAGMTQLPIYPE